MKKILFIIVLSFFLIGNAAFGADLVGTWSIQSDCARIGNHWVGDYWNNPGTDDPTGIYTNEPHQIVITDQDPVTGLFKGYSCDAEVPNTYFYGVIDGKTLHITHWDSVTFGKLKGNDSIKFISQNQQKNPESAPGTCIGTATKVSDTSDCDPLCFTFDHASGNYSNGVCDYTCDSGWYNCDDDLGDPDGNGCESNSSCP